MIFLKKPTFIFSLLLCINVALAQSVDVSLKTNPFIELGVNTKVLALKGTITEMQVHQFETDEQGRTKNDSASVSNLYKFNSNGLTKEIEETLRNSETKKSFFSYTNNGYISHIDIETTLLSKENDSTTISEQEPIFSTLDYKYVQKKNILFKGEDFTESKPKKTTTRKDYFYHFNEENQIFQIDNQSTDLVILYNYNPNGFVKESLVSKSGVALYKNIYRYDRNNRLINLTKINSGNTTKTPNEETIITYKLDSTGNQIEKKVKTYLYSPKAPKEFIEGYLYLYNYNYL